MKKYLPNQIEPRWQKKWEKEKIFQPDLKKAKKPFYNLMMFPYPSGEGLHVGNMYAFTGADIYGRKKRMEGFDVFEPIGLDGFGIHSENYALKIKKHPSKVAKQTEKTFYRQLEETGNAYAWESILETYDPDYYKWTQWVFIQMFKKGLAYRKEASVNWCPSCKTVLADEQVIAGQCERCNSQVETRKLKQWFFKITKYADRLLENLKKIDWSERVKVIQHNWIGRTEGITIDYPVVDSDKIVSCYSTRPDTNFGATFIVIAPEHPMVLELTTKKNLGKVKNYIKQSLRKSELERTELEKEKTGVFTGSYALNQLIKKKIPIWVSDFVVLTAGTGIVVGVPAHDERDYQFAKKYGLEIIPVIKPKKGKWDFEKGPFTDLDEAVVFNSDFLNGLPALEAKEKIIDYLVEKEWGKRAVNYHLRDWLISRQRYWGPPIPMINCQKCGWVPIAEKELPVLLPELENFQPKGFDQSPLAQLEDWVKAICPKCGGPAERETDVSDTFLDSAWYFLRYPSTDNDKVAWEATVTKKWLPVDMYIGGAEHSVLHLMYSRFLIMVFNDLGLLDFEEPYKKFYAHGLITKDGAKMSKSKGNVVIPDEYIKSHGADTLRMYLMFLGPFNQGGDFADAGIEGVRRFLTRVWQSIQENNKVGQETSPKLKCELHRLIRKVTKDIEGLKYNTAIAAMMGFLNSWSQESLSKEDAGVFLRLLAPFAPHITEELWVEVLKNKFSVHTQPWPKHDPKLAKEEKVEIVVQVNGKLRDTFEVSQAKSKKKADLVKEAKARPKIENYLKDKKMKKTIFVPGKLINFVV